MLETRMPSVRRSASRRVLSATASEVGIVTITNCVCPLSFSDT